MTTYSAHTNPVHSYGVRHGCRRFSDVVGHAVAVTPEHESSRRMVPGPYGPEPVTGSASMPEPGAKKRDMKSNAGEAERAVVEDVLRYRDWSRGAQGRQQGRWRFGGNGRLHREVELDPLAATVSGQQAAARVEACLGAGGLRQHSYCGGITGEWLVGECVDGHNSYRHTSHNFYGIATIPRDGTEERGGMVLSGLDRHAAI